MRKLVLALPAVVLVAASMAAAATRDTRLTLVAYSTPREAYGEIIPGFQKTDPGRDVSFSQSYGSSGEQSRAVQAGLKADIVALSLAPDVNALVEAGLVDPKWNRQSYRGMVHRSVVVFVVRDGNPKNIKGWNDLLRPGISVITPNPFTSGGARWNVMAAYGAWRRAGKTDRQAQDNLLKLFRNVSVQDKSARESLQTFASGKGDVLLAYENEAFFARSRGQNLQFRIPRSTILIENPIAVLKGSPNKATAEAFLRYLRFPDRSGSLRGTATDRC
ncbi:MAG: sulfate ABC transporter substrate-binding protein [Actinobacteria bacterium]|nr:sulfate ABC transporter substrate-binding protein [Actinomycetota bacterium]